MAVRQTILSLILGSLMIFPAFGAPRSFNGDAVPLDQVERYEIAPVDVEALIAEDLANVSKGVPFRAASPVKVVVSPGSCGTIDHTGDGGDIWRLRVYSENALFLSFIFGGFFPGEGLELYVYAPDGSFLAGPYTSMNITPDGILATPVVPGRESVIEIYFPGGITKTDITLDEVCYGYKSFFSADISGACEVDINCPTGDNWQDEKRAVAHIYFRGYICTGTLLNDVPQDCRNYFLTANHCISKTNEASSCIFYWNYENTSCGSADGSLLQNQTGSVIRATDKPSDFTLLELNLVPQPSFNVYYAGWTNSPSAPSGGICIHHPDGDVKKISVESDALVQGSYGTGFWRTPSWDIGVTEPGSSGSGLWDPDHRIVGQLYGGESYCGAPSGLMWDEYGKLSVSWTAGATPETRLRDWLDPAGTGAVLIDGRDGSTCGCVFPSQPVISSVTDNDPALPDGVVITFTPGTPALQHDLFRDGTLVQANITSPHLHLPGDSLLHSYVVRAVNGACTTDSAALDGVDEAAACSAPVQEVVETVNGSGFSWSPTDADNYRVVRGLSSDLAALLTPDADFSCRAFGSSTEINISADDPSAVSGRCYFYLIQGYNCADPQAFTGPAGGATDGIRQVDPAGECL